jgi:23S rRNA pseudouridine2605 synthase
VPDRTDDPRERLQKALARAGMGSRRACETMIAAGRVTVNGTRAELGDRVDGTRDRVEIDGVPVSFDATRVYYLLNKPVGVVSTARDPQGRRTVVELVPHAADSPRVVPVGRLDLDSEGLLVLTNDGELVNLLAHPSHGVDKTYLVEVDGVPSPAAVRTLRHGVALDDGITAPAKARVVQRASDRAAVEITIHEGRNRQVRRMLDAVGHPVRRLVRTRIGPVHDASLAPGEWRPLTTREVRALYAAALDQVAATRERSTEDR